MAMYYPTARSRREAVPAPAARRASAVWSGVYKCWRAATAAMLCLVLVACANFKQTDRFRIPDNTADFRSRLYAGGSVGSSNLKPQTRGTNFSVGSDTDTGTQLRLGYDVHNMLAIEFDTSVLGASQLNQFNTDVKYSSAAFSALIYGVNGVQMRSRREGLSAYGRIGAASLSKSSAVVALDDGGTVPIFGIGAEYGFSNGLGVRAEITRFDSDAIYSGLGVVYRFGLSPAGIGQVIAQAAEPALNKDQSRIVAQQDPSKSQPPETVVEYYAGPRARSLFNRGRDPNFRYTAATDSKTEFTASMADRWRPAMRADDGDSDGVLDNIDRCPGTTTHVTVDRFGCGLFDAVLEDVIFKSGSAWLTPRARGQLDLVADMLLVFPESRVQVRAHTDSPGSKQSNLALSNRRAEKVALYLQSRGVHAAQLEAVGMGETHPIDSNETSTGRKNNRRVDLLTLPEQDLMQAPSDNNLNGPGLIAKDADADSGLLVAINDENRNKQEKNNRSPRIKIPASPAIKQAEPGLLAAMPDQARKPILIAPLPRPGKAPGFPISGVIEGVQFAPGSSKLTTDDKDALEPLLVAMEKHTSVRVAVMAHTDNSGSSEDNLSLSEARAGEVVNYLAKRGIDFERLKPEGYGEMLPLVQNVTAQDRSRNRRIEIRIIASENRIDEAP
ncbi:MAG: OmpA family protein [Granulosicoccus sp.]|nr:OmpA family protein [Granulosicoccus sp.]